MGIPEGESFIENSKNYNSIWSKAPFNTSTSKNKTSLNKELDKKSRQLTKEEVQRYASRRVEFDYKARKGTTYEMDVEKFDTKVNRLAGRPLRVAFKHRNDKKFRHFSERARYFCVFHPLLENVIQDNQELKTYLLSREDFKFDPVFIEGLQNLSINNSQLITRNEKLGEIENVSIWQNMKFILIFTLSDDSESLPLPDPFTM